MSASLVRKSLCIVDPDVNQSNGRREKSKKAKNVVNLMPQNHKITRKINKGRKVLKVDLLRNTQKLTVVEAKQRFKSEDQILKENLRKLKLIKKASRIDLNKQVTKQIFERARSRRPVKTRDNSGKDNKKTAFTEDDFKRFEAEYFDE